MPEAEISIRSINLIIFVAFVVVSILFVGYNLADTDVKMGEAYRSIGIKHAAHLVEKCLANDNGQIDIMTAKLRSCASTYDIDKIELTDIVTGQKKPESGWWNINFIGNTNHKIAVLIKNGDEIHPGWLYVEI